MSKRTTALLALTLACAFGGTAMTKPAAYEAIFSNTKMSGRHMFEGENRFPYKPDPAFYSNPILPGFYPDPSIERVGDDYYLINSTFAYYPGIPVFHSKDLVNWTQIGNAIDRPGMLDFSGLATSRGVFAPDLSYHDGTFYILNTCVDCKGNFLITAKNPAGPWSDPVWLPFDGIDPALFFDEDGKTYIVNNGGPDGAELYQGHRAIWMQEVDLKTGKMTGPRKAIVNGGVDISKKPVWIEGPHLIKKDGLYYLIAAEGGTAEDHSQVVFRSDKLWGPYVPAKANPILTQRDLDPKRPNPITSSGHADFVQTQKGDWWAVFLATRPYTEGKYNTGRETFLLPVTWKDGWPSILPQGKAIPYIAPRPDLPATKPPMITYDHVGGGYTSKTDTGKEWEWNSTPDMAWLNIRTPKDRFLTVENPRKLILKARPEAIGDTASHPSFIGLRQRNNWDQMETLLTFAPRKDGDRAGIVAIQNDDYYVFCGLTRQGGKLKVITLVRKGKSDPKDGVIVAEAPITLDAKTPLQLRLGFSRDRYYCHYLPQSGGNWLASMTPLVSDADATFLSTATAGGFVGTIIGLYAYGQKP